MKEIFRDAVGYEDCFQISNFGNLYSKRTNKILKQRLTDTGYYVIATKIGGRSGINKILRIHKLVAKAFIENPDNKTQVNHIDGNKQNNNVLNLEWVTPSENTKHAYDNNLAQAAQGINNVGSKLTEQDIFSIRNSNESCRSLAKIYNVHHSQISRAKRNSSYKNAGIV